MQTLNIFAKSETKSNQHEDVLTRAYLMLLKYSPYSKVQFFEYLRKSMDGLGIGSTDQPESFLSGINEVLEIKTQVSTQTLHQFSGRCVSILITDEKIDTGTLGASERQGILDGLLITADGYILCLENKPASRNVWLDQLNFALPEGLEIETRPIVLLWSEIFKSLANIVRNGLAADIEQELIQDFLSYIGEHFSYLNSFENFALCQNSMYLLDKRCASILEELDLGEVSWHKGWHYSVKIDNPAIKEISIYPENGANNSIQIHLALFPGDTMSQARALYEKIKETQISQLAKANWLVEPNFHFSYRSSNLYWCDVQLTLPQYIAFWRAKVSESELYQRARETLPEYFEFLYSEGMMSKPDVEYCHEYILSKAYTNLNICPGIKFLYTWSRSDADELDSRNQFTGKAVDLISKVLSCWS